MFAIPKITRMRYLRLQYRLELKDVADELGISIGYLSKLENNWYRRVPAYLAEAIIKFYGESFDELMIEVELPKIGTPAGMAKLSGAAATA